MVGENEGCHITTLRRERVSRKQDSLQRARATDAHSDEAEGVWLRSSFLLVSLAETSYRLWVLSAQAKLDTA